MRPLRQVLVQIRMEVIAVRGLNQVSKLVQEHVVFALRGIHTAAQLIAARPKRRMEFTLLDRHIGPLNSKAWRRIWSLTFFAFLGATEKSGDPEFEAANLPSFLTKVAGLRGYTSLVDQVCEVYAADLRTSWMIGSLRVPRN